MLEPAAVGTAVVTGPHLHNFADIARQLRSVDAMCVGEDADAVGDAIEALLADDARRAAMAAAGMELVEQGRGALARTLALVGRDLPRKPARSEEHTSELQSLMRISYAVSCLQQKINHDTDIRLIEITLLHTS